MSKDLTSDERAMLLEKINEYDRELNTALSDLANARSEIVDLRRDLTNRTKMLEVTNEDWSKLRSYVLSER